MINFTGLSICLLALFCTVYVVNGDFEEVPENTVAMVGSTVILRCVALPIPTPRVIWTEFVNFPQGRVISDNRAILPSHPNAARYQIIGAGNEYHLQISNLTMVDAGRYLCGDPSSNPPAMYEGYAQLVVMAGDPVCTELSTITGVIVEDIFYTKQCDVQYMGYFPPNMTWVGPGDYNVDVSVSPTESWTRVSFTARRDIEGSQFVCTTRFVQPADPFPPNSATNIPSYEYVFRGSVLIVNWGPQEITIIPRKEFYEVGDVLTCEADAKPPATYIWSNLRTQGTEPVGATFTVTAALLGTEQIMRCNAYSLIEGTLYTADSFVNVSVPIVTGPTTPTTTPITTPPPADSPCTDLTGQWSAINPDALLCIEVDSKGNVLSLLRNGTDPFFVTGRGKTVYNDYKHIGLTGIWPAGSRFGVGGFVGECHRCFGNEIIQMSGLARNQEDSPNCGLGSPTRLTNLYSFTRYGPPCRGLKADVYRPSEDHIRAMGIPKEHIIT